MDQTLVGSLPKDVAALPSRVLSSLSSVKLLETISSASESNFGDLSPVAHGDGLFDTDFEAKR